MGGLANSRVLYDDDLHRVTRGVARRRGRNTKLLRNCSGELERMPEKSKDGKRGKKTNLAKREGGCRDGAQHAAPLPDQVVRRQLGLRTQSAARTTWSISGRRGRGRCGRRPERWRLPWRRWPRGVRRLGPTWICRHGLALRRGSLCARCRPGVGNRAWRAEEACRGVRNFA